MKTLSLRLTDEMHENLRQEAFSRRLSISEIIRQRIGGYYSTEPSRPLVFNKLTAEPKGEFGSLSHARMGDLPPSPLPPPIHVDIVSSDVESLPQPQMKPEQP